MGVPAGCSVPPDDICSELSKTLCQPSSITFGQGRLAGNLFSLLQWVADLLCVPLCLPVTCCLRVAELGAALWVLVHSFALSVCLPRGPVVLCSVSCAFCHKGFSGKSDSAPNMKTRPSFHIHHAEHWGCVMDRWASGILCFWQLGM